MKSLEQEPNTDGNNKEFIQIAQQVREGVVYERIPTDEASTLLKKFIKDNDPGDKLVEARQCAALIEDIEEGVRLGWISGNEATEFLQELNNKYPVKKNKLPKNYIKE